MRSQDACADVHGATGVARVADPELAGLSMGCLTIVNLV